MRIAAFSSPYDDVIAAPRCCFVRSCFYGSIKMAYVEAEMHILRTDYSTASENAYQLAFLVFHWAHL